MKVFKQYYIQHVYKKLAFLSTATSCDGTLRSKSCIQPCSTTVGLVLLFFPLPDGPDGFSNIKYHPEKTTTPAGSWILVVINTTGLDTFFSQDSYQLTVKKLRPLCWITRVSGRSSTTVEGAHGEVELHPDPRVHGMRRVGSWQVKIFLANDGTDFGTYWAIKLLVVSFDKVNRWQIHLKLESWFFPRGGKGQPNINRSTNLHFGDYFG